MSDVFKVLNDREHTLLRGHIMLGSLVQEPYELYISGKLTTLNIVPAVIKIVFEIIDNTVDEHCRSNKRHATKVNINMTPLSLTVEDNGRGIPVEYYKLEDGKEELRPVLCWTRLRAGTSFENHTYGPSANGVGSSISCIFSRYFNGETCDGKKICKVICNDNMETINSYVENANGHPKGTKVSIEPDFERFGIDCFTPDHIAVVKERILALSASYPTMTFTFNGEKIRTKKPIEYLEYYNKPFVPYKSDNYFFGIMPTDTDEYYQVTYIEGLHVKNGGSVDAYISREVSYALRDIIKKKYKLEMSPGEIKRGLLIVFDGCMFPDMKFDSQTKERMVNSESEVKSYLGQIDFEKIAKDIVNVSEIIEPIIEAKMAKQIAAEKRANTLAQKKMAKKYVEKHLAAKSKNINDTVLLLCEGDSAKSTGGKVRDIQKHGFYAMRGCVKNTFGLSDKAILENKELNDIMTILGLRFDMTKQEIIDNLNYGKIGILCDADTDGAGHIATLVINFLYKWKELFDLNKVFIVTSPRYIFTKNKGKKNEERIYCYTKEEYEAVRDKYKSYELRYIKGLGSLRDKEFRDVLDSTNKWLCVHIDDAKCLDIMFSNNVEERRKIMGI